MIAVEIVILLVVMGFTIGYLKRDKSSTESLYEIKEQKFLSTDDKYKKYIGGKVIEFFKEDRTEFELMQFVESLKDNLKK